MPKATCTDELDKEEPDSPTNIKAQEFLKFKVKFKFIKNHKKEEKKEELKEKEVIFSFTAIKKRSSKIHYKA